MADLILALDLPTPEEALDLVERIGDAGWVKVGPVLFNRAGPALVRELVERGTKVFLDCKWHDIPSTVQRAVETAGAMGVDMVTVHTLGGPAMLEGALEGARSSGLSVVGVTVLTSHSRGEFGAIVGREIGSLDREVERLARLAHGAGLSGVVCSPHEIRTVREELGEKAAIVVPGVRRPEDSSGDQHRVAAPGEVVEAGATHLVVGRPIYLAPDPVGAYREFQGEVR